MHAHPSAVVSKKAEIADTVTIGAYTIIADGVRLLSKVAIGSHCVIEGNTTIGEGCKVYTGAVIGSPPQDLKYKGEKSSLVIGGYTIIREYCTFNPGTQEGGKTSVGDHNLFMAYSHVAHDCSVGSHCVIANNGTLAGHVTVEDGVVIGGLVAIHQFVRVGKLSMIGGCSKVVQDIPPFSTCDGHPARVFGLNLVGLRRNGISSSGIEALDAAFKILFNAGLNKRHALERLEKEAPKGDEVSYLIDFVKKSTRGLSRSCHAAP